MTLWRRLAARPFRQRGAADAGGYEPPPGFVRRHLWKIIATAAVAVAGVAMVVWWLWPNPCGPGLTQAGSPKVCVGLNLDSTAFRGGDPLADLEKTIADRNAAITGPFVTIVLLEDMTPDPNTGSFALGALRHDIEGAITGVWQANNSAVAGGTLPKIKLLLANLGTDGDFHEQAVAAIEQARLNQHIVAVTGIGQSLAATREAAAALSNASIAVVGSMVTADNMNDDPDTGKHLDNFYRVGTTNADQARAAVAYLGAHSYHQIMLIADQNPSDSYAQTLATAFTSQSGVTVKFTERFRSPNGALTAATRAQDMISQFSQMHSDICGDQPDLIYFAGRGVDLKSFLTAMSTGGACSLGPLDVMTGDDAANLVGAPIPSGGDVSTRVFYTALAYRDEWAGLPSNADQVLAYHDFEDAFTTSNGFNPGDLADGHAMVNDDAVIAAATAARNDPLATTDPSTVGAYFLYLRCTRTIRGASGDIAFGSDGNPIDKATPIMRIQPDGSVTQEDLVWPTGTPLDPKSTC